MAFSLFFGVNAVSIGIGAAFAAQMSSAKKAIIYSITILNACSWGLMLVVSVNASIIFFEGLLLILCFGLGMIFTVSTAAAMDAARNKAGTASALLGASGFLFGSLVSPLVGMGNIMLSTSAVLIVSALFTSVFAWKGSRDIAA